MPKYSIVTPVFNSFKLMTRYFESLLNQTFKDFEVVLVDDCSSDGSYEQLKKYCENSPLNISLLKTETNAGPGNARNIGMYAAQGEWLTFIDNDDWVDIRLLEKIEEVLSKNDVDSIIYDYYITNGKSKKIAHSMYFGSGGAVSLSDCMIYVRNHTVGKFYKLSKCINKGIKFPPIKRCEDVAFVMRAIIACGSAYYLDEPLYYYYQRPTSLSNNTSLDETDMIKAFGFLEQDLSVDYSKELTEKSVSDLFYGVLLMMCKAGKCKKEIVSYINEYENRYPNWENTEIIKHLGKAKKAFLKLAKNRNVAGMKVFSIVHSLLVSWR